MPFAPEYLHLVFPSVTFEAWLYGRNSDDATKTGDSVEDQLATGRRLCERHIWRIVHEFKDTGISASRHGRKARDDFEDLLATIVSSPASAGVRRVLVAYNASRYYRDLEAYVRLRNACLTANVLLCYNGQVYDLSRRDDRKATAMHAVDAEDEAEGLRDQNLRTATLQAEEGKPHGKLPFGYLREYAIVGGRKRCVRQYEHPEQGPIIVKALQHIDAGRSMISLVRWLNTEPKAARPGGKQWSGITARRMLMNRRYLGERLHNGEYRTGTWEPLKGLETPQGRAMFNRVTAILNEPGRRTQRGTEVSHLLSFVGVCGLCGDHEPLGTWVHSKGQPMLGCKRRRHAAIREDLADAFVEEAILAWFSNKTKARATLVPDGDETAAATEATQRLVNGLEEQLREARTLSRTFDTDTGRPMLTAASLAEMEQTLGPRLEAERKKLTAASGVHPLLTRLLTAEDPDVVWNGRPATESEPALPGLSLEQKREVIRLVVTVRFFRPARPRQVDGDRIRLSFAGEPGFRDRPLRARGSAHAGEPGLAVVSEIG